MNEASKNILINTLKEWNKFVVERDRLKAMATEVAGITQRIVLENLAFLKAQHIDVAGENVAGMKIMGHPVVIEPIIETTFPNVKARVNLTCSGANRSIVISPDGRISAGAAPVMFEQLKKAIPDSFLNNAAEFVSDSFLFIVRNMGSDQKH